MRIERLSLVLTLLVLVGLVGCTEEKTAHSEGPPEEIFWRFAQESLRSSQRIEDLTLTRMAECQLSENTKASFGYVSEWVVDYETEVSNQDGASTSRQEVTSVVALKENGAWVSSGWPPHFCTDR